MYRLKLNKNAKGNHKELEDTLGGYSLTGIHHKDAQAPPEPGISGRSRFTVELGSKKPSFSSSLLNNIPAA